ncbi:MAG: SufE family protein [Candidatus Thermoplasmatota archaeon]|nr:SufE family protein [Candidatus Thermoplasmatota archaeon]|tara:strand:+ start:745 stop:1173 length:429 start_codon:yes stop_codon:yes gene_type:complete
MNEWPTALQEIIEDFQDCFDRMERYELLFEYAKRMPHPLPIEEWTEQNRVQGCQSEAHVECVIDDNGFHIHGAADAQLVQGLMAVLAIGVDGLSPNEVSQLTPKFVDEMDVKASLTPSRANGFLNLFEMIRSEAEKHIKQSK